MSSPQDPFAAPSGPPSYGQQPPAAPPYGQELPAYGGAYGPPPGYGQQPSGFPGPGYQGQSTDSKAIIALVCAIGSFVVFPVVPAIVALVLAPQARRDIAASGGRLTGEGLVTAAKVIAWINLVLCLLAVLGFVLLFGVLASAGFSEGGDVVYPS